jgi:hypothetical protein
MYPGNLTPAEQVDFIVREATFAMQTPRALAYERAQRVAGYSDVEQRFCRELLAQREASSLAGPAHPTTGRSAGPGASHLPTAFVELLRDHRSALERSHGWAA